MNPIYNHGLVPPSMLNEVFSEGSSPIDIVIDRNGGSLVTRHVQYTVVPNGAAEFYGYTNVLKFEPGIMKMSAALLPIADGIPEKEERFTLTLNSYGNSTSDIGSRSQITIDILENDNPYGLIQFEDDPPVLYMDESTLSGTVTNLISVQRTQGTFGSITVAWDIIPSNQQDLTPLSGSITFGESQGQGTIQITTVPDDIPESAENFTIQLNNPTGGAELGSRQTFTIIINQNDFPVYFQESVYHVAEGSLLTVTIHREGDASKQETVKYRTLDGTALVGDYNKLTNQDAVFAVGKTDVSFQVVINEDTLPEGNETFFIEIFQIMGDLVTTRGSNCSIVILANDNAYGIFKLSPPLSVRVEEGSHLELTILRDGGVYGEVEVSWEIIDVLTNKMPPDGSQFDKSNGTVLFTEGLHRQTFTIFPRSDLAPEKERVYTVRLHDIEVVVGRTDVELASLAGTDLEVTLTIEESDDPYGRFAFAYNSTEVTIAEDYYPGEQSKTEAKLVVERRMGGFGNVQVVWEIYTYQVAVTMPSVYDLLLIAEPSSDVGKTPGKRRPYTGTDVMYFDGAVSNCLGKSSDRQPPPEDLKNGYTISAWIQPFADLNSYIVAKTTDDGSRFYKYTQGHYRKQWCHILNNQQISVTTNTNIKDGGWHHILVTVDSVSISFYLDGGVLDGGVLGTNSRSSSISFYLDGGVLGTKLLNSQPLIDLTGRLHVGAIAPGNEMFIGYLQDVRIYTRKLTTIEMNEVYNLPSKTDLSPVSGYLSYHEALREQTIVVTASQDLEEENNEMFTVMLLTANNGGTLSKTDRISRITIEKSDNANGVFSIRTCSPSQALTETTTVSCTVDRQREMTTFTLTVKDDDIPEVDEIFHIRLLTVASTDGSQGPTNTSGASIDLSKSSSVFTILKNDHSNGVLQFSNRTRPPTPDEGILPVAKEEPTIKVYEEAGTIALMVVRAQGTAGFVTVEWRTTDGTAKSSGISTPDYQVCF
ncbi:ADGRV1 [Mytilus edulis]|uniref:ADGRV1 n=1 Tax=Mytilus edulis TaxID=6550 RepID=A0A8S3VIU3_MYTED|nr:ADGRV1 [Mytilus edulis]